MFFLFRLFGALIAAAVVSVGVIVVGALFLKDTSPEFAAGCMILTVPPAALGVAALTYRRLGTGKWAQRRAEGQIRQLKEHARERGVAPKATLVATVLGGGIHTTATLRAAWDGRGNGGVSVDAVQGGAWRTVLLARFHPEVPGQVVPSTIRPSVFEKDGYTVSTTRAGHQPAWWEVMSYIPGDWEAELDRLWEAAKQAQHEREKERFGIE